MFGRKAVKGAEDVRAELEAAREAVAERGDAITAARERYRQALDAEAMGRATAGASREAKRGLDDAEHAAELAGAKVRVLERELAEAELREARDRAGEIVREIHSADAQADALARRLAAAVEDLVNLLDECDEVNATGQRLNVEGERLAQAIGEPRALRYAGRRVRLSGDVRRRLGRIVEVRGLGDGFADFAP